MFTGMVVMDTIIQIGRERGMIPTDGGHQNPKSHAQIHAWIHEILGGDPWDPQLLPHHTTATSITDNNFRWTM